MLTLQTLRNKAGLLVSITIGLALVAFILGDLVNPRKSMFAGNDKNIAEVNGQEIPYTTYFDLQKQIEENYQANGASLDEQTRNMIANQSWDQIIREVVYQQEYKKIGLGIFDQNHGIIGISSEELADITYGNNVDPQIQQIFRNQETGMFDKNLATNFLQNMDKDPEKKKIWIGIEKQLIAGRIATKYTNLITKGIYTTSAEAKQIVAEKGHKAEIKYVSLSFYSIPDSTCKATDEQIKEYYNKNKEDFKQETSRDIEYVVFPINASQDDFMATQKFVTDLTTDFQSSDNDEMFVNSNSSVPFDNKFYKKGALPVNIDSLAFANGKGTLIGPYVESNYVKLSKVSRVEMLPDSVKARHILITKGDAMKVADSLKNLIEKGADFALLAMQYSEDTGSKIKGGDLGWFQEGAMVKPFNDSCFFGKVGKIYITPSQFGVHIIQVLERGKEMKKIQVATISAKIEASTKTRNIIFGEASAFASKISSPGAYKAEVESNSKIDKRVAPGLKPSDRSIPGIESARQIVRWAYKSEKESVSDVFDCNSTFVVAYLKEIHEKGYASVEESKTQIEMAVIKENKAKKLIDQINGAGSYASLEDLASKLTNVQVQTASTVTFSNPSVAGIGMEPKVAAVASVLESGKLSKPIEGNNGIYVIAVTSAIDTPESDVKTEQETNSRMISSRVGYSIFNVLKEKADIEDNRSSFE